jgi:signal transduction histidine kinase/CheY-like chemotaxis protein
MPPVDIRTLAFALMILRFTQVPLLAYVWRVHRSYRPAQDWALGSGCEALAFLLFSLRNVASPVLTILIANALLLSGHFMFAGGICRAAGGKPRRRTYSAAVFISACILAYFTYIQPSTFYRVLVYTCTVCPYYVYAAWVCLKYEAGILRPTLRTMAALLLGITVLLIWRASGSINSDGDLMKTSPQTVLFGIGQLTFLLSSTAIVVLLASQRLQQELAQAIEAADLANRAKSIFLTTMSHELRTPLNGILGYSQVLLADLSLNKRQRDGLSTIQHSGEHLLGLINDVLDLAKVEAGKLDLAQDEFALLPMLNSVVELMKVRAKQKGLSLEYLCALPPQTVVGDPRRLRQVLLNLLGNAVKFTETGSVKLEVSRRDSAIAFVVEDSGVGISPSDLATLFQPFSQLGSTQKKSEGTGLGLAITQRIVEMMGGQMSIESVPGQGSRFQFQAQLPEVGGADSGSPTTIQRIGYEGPPKKILVVDDMADNRAICLAMLSPLGFQLEEAADGQQALEVIATSSPDCVLMDMSMPRMDGLTAVGILRRDPKTISLPIIMLSANAYEEDRVESLQAGCDAFLSKPLRIESLLQEIGSRLGLHWTYANDSLSLRQLSDQLLDQIQNATEVGDLSRIEGVLREIEVEHPNCWSRLQELANRFDYDTILDLVSEARKEKTAC